MQEQPSLLIAKNAMPDLLAAMEGRAGEADFLGALWDCLADGRLFRARQVLADFCESAPPLLMVADKERPPWHNDFFQRCANGIAVVEAEDGGEEKLWAQLKSGEPADACPPMLKECWQGTAASLHQTAAIALEVARDFLQYGDVGIAVYDRLLAPAFAGGRRGRRNAHSRRRRLAHGNFVVWRRAAAVDANGDGRFFGGEFFAHASRALFFTAGKTAGGCGRGMAAIAGGQCDAAAVVGGGFARSRRRALCGVCGFVFGRKTCDAKHRAAVGLG